jgi:hypothetical protein
VEVSNRGGGGARRTRSCAGTAGDVAYNGIHQWLAQTDHEKRMQWIASVEQIEALKPKIVVAGHKRPDARDDDPATILGHTKNYIRDFDQSLAESHSRVAIEDRDAAVAEALDQPRASFAGHPPETPWNTLQLAHFVGTAMGPT